MQWQKGMKEQLIWRGASATVNGESVIGERPIDIRKVRESKE